LMSGLDLRYDLGGPDPLVGTRMPDLDLSVAQGITTRVSTLLRTGRGLLLELGDNGAVASLPAGVLPGLRYRDYWEYLLPVTTAVVAVLC